MGLAAAKDRRSVAHPKTVRTPESVAVAGRTKERKGNDTASAATRAAPMASARAKATTVLPHTATQRHRVTAAERTRPGTVLIGIQSQ